MDGPTTDLDPAISALVRRIEALEAKHSPQVGNVQREVEAALSSAIIDALPVGVAAAARSGSHLHVNAALQRTTGYSREELTDPTQPFAYWPRDAIVQPASILEQAACGDGISLNLELRRRSGERFPALVSAVVLPDSDGCPCICLIVVRDLSEEHRARHQLQRRLLHQKLIGRIARALLCTLGDELADVVGSSLRDVGLTYGLDQVAVLWNEMTCSRVLHEWQRDGAQPRHDVLTHDRYPWIAARCDARDIRRVASAADLPVGDQQRFMRSLDLAALVEVPLEADGAVRGFAFFATRDERREWLDSEVEEFQLLADIIGAAQLRERMHRRLAASESRYWHVVEDQTDFIVRWRPDGTRTFVNESYCAAFGITRDDAIGSTFLDLISPEDRRRVQERLDALNEGDPVSTAEHRVLRPDGAIGWQRWTDRAVFDANGKLIEMQSVGRDITERKQAEETLKRALAEIEVMKNRLAAENVYLREEVRLAHGFDEIVGDSPALNRCLHEVERVAPTSSTVLITGDTGTGKDLIARKIHELSRRADGPLVCVNCAALPSHLAESELFGHERGAFTGAERRRFGRFELADRGTLFLDEVGELSLELQATLLRAIQDGRFERVGGDETIEVDVRVVAATNRDLERAVAESTFRQDLYFRLNVYPISVPSLGERRSDIKALVLHFIAKHAAALGHEVEGLSGRVLDYLERRAWPGNIRELESWVQRVLITSAGSILDVDLTRHPGNASPVAGEAPLRLEEVERQHIRCVLDAHDWRIEGGAGAAKVLGLNPSTLRSRMKRLGISRRGRES